MPFDYTSGNPDNLVGGGPARMQDIQGPFYDIRAYLNSAVGGGGASTPVLAGVPILDVGMTGQRRAGRQLTNADFTALGLTIPLALWNLNDLTDASGNGRVLANKGAVGFAGGINGIAASAAQFAGSTAQVLYVADTGAADPFRIKTGSWGCWFRTAKRGTTQAVAYKCNAAISQIGWGLLISATNVIGTRWSVDGPTAGLVDGLSDVCDDRWHFAVATVDGTAARIFVDGVLENSVVMPTIGSLFGSSGPVNIGGLGGDGGTASQFPHFGRVDEMFVTSDVLSEEQVRLLYASKLTHTLASTPSTVTLNVHRLRKGAALTVGDFTTQPLRLHNFTQPTPLADEGSNGVALAVIGGTVDAVNGADGARGAAYGFASSGQVGATDAGLPAGLTTRSYGCWFKTAMSAPGSNVIAWGTASTGDCRLYTVAPGQVGCANAGDSVTGPFVADGQWHHAVVVEDNGAADGIKRKLYVDGRVAAISTVMNAVTLAGAQRFRVAAASDGTGPFTGQVDGAFVCNYALTAADVAKLYAKGSQDSGASPKNPGDHVERVDSSSVYFIGDTLESQHTVDLGVMA